jgi:hypothetical protein
MYFVYLFQHGAGAVSVTEVIENLVKKYSVDLSDQLEEGVSPWKVAADWVTDRHVLPDRAPQLGECVSVSVSENSNFKNFFFLSFIFKVFFPPLFQLLRALSRPSDETIKQGQVCVCIQNIKHARTIKVLAVSVHKSQDTCRKRDSREATQPASKGVHRPLTLSPSFFLFSVSSTSSAIFT